MYEEYNYNKTLPLSVTFILQFIVQIDSYAEIVDIQKVITNNCGSVKSRLIK